MRETKAVRVTYSPRVTQYTDGTVRIEIMRYLGAARQLTNEQWREYQTPMVLSERELLVELLPHLVAHLGDLRGKPVQ